MVSCPDGAGKKSVSVVVIGVCGTWTVVVMVVELGPPAEAAGKVIVNVLVVTCGADTEDIVGIRMLVREVVVEVLIAGLLLRTGSPVTAGSFAGRPIVGRTIRDRDVLVELLVLSPPVDTGS